MAEIQGRGLRPPNRFGVEFAAGLKIGQQVDVGGSMERNRSGWITLPSGRPADISGLSLGLDKPSRSVDTRFARRHA
jgi:hypothetical protein